MGAQPFSRPSHPEGPVVPSERVRVRRWVSPIVCWSVAGVVLVAIGGGAILRWALADIPHWGVPNGEGLSPARKASIVLGQFVLIAVWITSLVVGIRQSRREGRLSIIMMMFIAMQSSMWMSPIVAGPSPARYEAFSTFSLYTTDWGTYLPFWRMPNPPFEVEQVTGEGFFAWGGPAICPIVIVPLMRLVVRRWPILLQGPRLGLVSLAINLVYVFISDWPFALMGDWSWVYAAPHASFMGGHWYQFPYSYYFSNVFFWCLLPCLLVYYYSPAGGPGVVFGGIGRMSARWHSAARLLAVIGVMNIAILIWALLLYVVNVYTGGGTPIQDVPPAYG
jgi:hypothetical protein